MKEIENPELEKSKKTLGRWEDALSEEYFHDQDKKENNNQEYKSLTLVCKRILKITKI